MPDFNFDPEIEKMRAHLDQTRSHMRELVLKMGEDKIAKLVRGCAEGRCNEYDEKGRLLIGLLAITAIFNLIDASNDL